MIVLILVNIVMIIMIMCDMILMFMIILIVIICNIFSVMLATIQLFLLQGTPSERDSEGQRRGLRNEDFCSHEYGSHPHHAGSHRGARTDSDLESPDAGDYATFTSITRPGLEVRHISTSVGAIVDQKENTHYQDFAHP